MSSLISLLVQDTVLLASFSVFIATAAILAWAITTRNRIPAAVRETPAETAPLTVSPESLAMESSGLLEARLGEFSRQLAEIGQRVSEIEKAVSQKRPADDAVTAAALSSEIERLAQRIESKLQPLAADAASNDPGDLARLEAKLEGIQRLLIILTDNSSDSGQR